MFSRCLLIIINLCFIAAQATDERQYISDIQKLKDDFQNLQNSINMLSKTMSDMDRNRKTEIESLRKERKEAMSAMFEKFKGQRWRNDAGNQPGQSRDRRLLFPPTASPVHNKQIAFSFDLSRDLNNLGHYHTIIYNHEILNYGNSYNKNDGIFTVPTTGIYLLNWSTMVGDSLTQVTELVVDGKHISSSNSAETNGYESSGKTVIINLTRGSTVWIRTDGSSSSNTAHALRGHGYNSFSGFLATDGRTDEIQKLKDEFQDLHDSIITLSMAMSDMDKNQKAEIESLRKQQKQEMSAILEEFKSHRLSVDGDGNIAAESRDRRLLFPPTASPAHSKQIAFSVDLSRDLNNLGHYHTIIYNHEILNYGNNYNKNDGIFTVPITGIYLLNWSTMAGPSLAQGTELVVDGKHISSSNSAETSGYESSGKTVILNLTRGSTVWIRTDGVSGTYTAHGLRGHGYNSFSGFLIYPRE